MDPQATRRMIVELNASGTVDDMIEARYLQDELNRWTARGGF